MYFIEIYQDKIINISFIVVAYFLLKKFYISGGSCKNKNRVDGQTVIITGANTGIGKETALELAKRGARVILACRDMNKAMHAANEIRKVSGNGNVFVEYLDLATLDSVKKFSSKIYEQEEKVNILINNGGICGCPKSITKDGFETHFGVNHLGHFFLTNLLLDKIKASEPSRIINVSSRGQERGRIHWDDIMFDKEYNSLIAYEQSKLANVLFTIELKNHLKGTQVTCCALHPGVVYTEIARHITKSNGILFRILCFFILIPLFRLFSKTPKEGAQTSIYCATIDKLDAIFYSDCSEKQLKKHALDEQDAKRLWNLSENLTKTLKKNQ